MTSEAPNSVLDETVGNGIEWDLLRGRGSGNHVSGEGLMVRLERARRQGVKHNPPTCEAVRGLEFISDNSVGRIG